MAPSPRTVVKLFLVAIIAALPFIVVSLTPWAALSGVVLLGLMPLLGIATAGVRAMATTGAVAAVVSMLAVLLTGTGALLPWLGTALVLVLALLASPLVKIGRASTGAIIIVLAVYIMAAPSGPVSAVIDGPLAMDAVVLGLLVAASCAWTIAVVGVILRRSEIPKHHAAQPTMPYTTLLAVLAGIFTFVTLTWFPGTNAWWSVLTVAVILQPTGAHMREKLFARVAGTVLGGAVALAAVLWLPPMLVTVLGAAAGLATVITMLMGIAYWIYASALTVTIVLTSFTPQDAVAGDILRVGITLGTAVVTAVAAVIAARFMRTPSSGR
ncbi:hypothetical protein GCM10009808_09470 [Microbacterium sediminicola]|uniref:Integral membrane bound transporter domain-containing protein n=1 Tax=Microbacterium sediminicola TaxID=415210 RepID=A0ABN2HW01_9MICO